MTIGERLIRASDALDRLVAAASAALLLALLGVSLAGMVHQVVLSSALTWSFSIARLLLPWIAMLSLTVAFKRGEHVAMAGLLGLLPPRYLRAVELLNLGLVGLFGLALAWFGYDFFATSTQLFMVSERLQVSHQWIAASVPVSGVVLCVHMLGGVGLLGRGRGAATAGT